MLILFVCGLAMVSIAPCLAQALIPTLAAFGTPPGLLMLVPFVCGLAMVSIAPRFAQR